MKKEGSRFGSPLIDSALQGAAYRPDVPVPLVLLDPPDVAPLVPEPVLPEAPLVPDAELPEVPLAPELVLPPVDPLLSLELDPEMLPP